MSIIHSPTIVLVRSTDGLCMQCSCHVNARCARPSSNKDRDIWRREIKGPLLTSLPPFALFYLARRISRRFWLDCLMLHPNKAFGKCHPPSTHVPEKEMRRPISLLGLQDVMLDGKQYLAVSDLQFGWSKKKSYRWGSQVFWVSCWLVLYGFYLLSLTKQVVKSPAGLTSW